MTKIVETMFFVDVAGVRYGPFETGEAAQLYASRHPGATVEEFRGVLTSSQEITAEEYERFIEGRTLPGVVVPPDA